MKKLIATFLTLILVSNLAFAQGYENDIYESSVVEVANKLKLEKGELDQIAIVLAQLKKDLKSAKVSRNIAMGVGIPIALFTGVCTFKAFTISRPTNVFAIFIDDFVKTLGFITTGLITVGMGSWIYLTQKQVNQIEKTIDLLQSKVGKRKNQINKQIELLQE